MFFCRDSDLTLDQLDAVANCVPTPGEVVMLQAFDGDKARLGKAEQFVLQMGTVESLPTVLQVSDFCIQLHHCG